MKGGWSAQRDAAIDELFQRRDERLALLQAEEHEQVNRGGALQPRRVPRHRPVWACWLPAGACGVAAGGPCERGMGIRTPL